MATRRILVTGAGGKTGRAVLSALSVRGAHTTGIVRSAAHDVPADVLVAGDQRSPDVLARAAAGADAVYVIAPNLSPHEVEMAAAILATCRDEGVDRVVLHSVVHPQLRSMPHHHDKGRAEELLVESGLRWTILQPNAYLQNLAAYVAGMREGVLRVPYAVDRGSALVDLNDVAEVAASTLLDDLAVHATLELSGPEECTPQGIAAVAAGILGREVRAERVEPVLAVAALPGLDEARRGRLLAMLQHYDLHGSPGDATVLRALLRREPHGIRDVLPGLLASPSEAPS